MLYVYNIVLDGQAVTAEGDETGVQQQQEQQDDTTDDNISDKDDDNNNDDGGGGNKSLPLRRSLSVMSEDSGITYVSSTSLPSLFKSSPFLKIQS